MRDGLLQMIFAIFNIVCVMVLCYLAGPPVTQTHGILRAIFVVCYFVTLILLSKGEDDDEDNQ